MPVAIFFYSIWGMCIYTSHVGQKGNNSMIYIDVVILNNP